MDRMIDKPVLVIKIGSAVLSDEKTLNLRLSAIKIITDQIVLLSKDFKIILVTSGAVASGQNNLLETDDRGCEMARKKAAAAIGNPLLINSYQEYFDKDNIKVAQILCERHHFFNKKLLGSLRETIGVLWRNNIIPIINENDVISDYELKFSDNDQLAVLLSVSFSAKRLLLGTHVDGLMNADGVIVPEITKFTVEIFEMVFGKKDIKSIGSGGMRSKLTNAKLATSFGIQTTIFNAQKEDGIINAIKNKTGTNCLPRENIGENRVIKNITQNGVIINQGVEIGRLANKGITKADIKSFSAEINNGEMVEIFSSEKEESPIAVGVSNVDGADFGTSKPELVIIKEVLF